MFLPKLAISNLRSHKIRAILTISAIALSVCLVVAVTSGYSSASASAQKMMAQYMGTTDAQITHNSGVRSSIDQSVLAELKKDPDVERADGRLETNERLLKADGTPIVARSSQIIGVQRPQDTRVDVMKMEEGAWFDKSDSDQAVIDQVAQQRLGVKIGDTFLIPGVDRQLKLRVVGVVHKPGILASAIQTVYVPLETLQKFLFPENPQQVTRILIDLLPKANPQKFVDRWREKLAAIDPSLRIRLSSENRKEMEKNLQGMHALSYLAGIVSMVAAMFIVFSALSMGVIERQRTLGMLRAIGAFRSQLGWLVIFEAIMLGIAGVVIGVPIGIACIKVLAWKFDFIFSAGAVISIDGVAFATIAAIFTTLAASLLPVISAMRTNPLEAMTPLARSTGDSATTAAAIAGLILITIDPVILYGPWNRSFQFFGHYTVGLACVMIGFFLLAPMFVRAIERFIGPLVAKMLGLNFAMLRQQFSNGIWRAAGTCAALMVGLAILVVTQTQGTTAISGWKLPDKFPDIFIFSGIGLNAADQAKLAQVKGIRSGELMPVAIASPTFGSNIFAIAGAAAIIPDSTMFFGIDPDKAFDLMELDFREGNATDAKRLLKEGKHVIVTQEYKQIQNLGLGGKIPLRTNKGVVDFTIAGVVWSPGIDVITSMHDLGHQFDQRTAASLFGTLADAQECFGVDRIHLFAANLLPNVDKQEFLNNTMRNWGLEAGDVRQIKFGIQQALARVLLLISTIAYAAMAVASLGVTNTIMASIRSRRWQFGILRSIGATRGQLLRLVLAEAILIGVVSVALGLCAGFEMSIDAWRSWQTFFGYSPAMVVPWSTIGIGASVVIAVAVLASLWPALHTARTE
ncbi:MAG TPA: FtsX-like permease family protein, partial [Tepidisphaeraceae bacterium]|nr:FtsX-like permease family protein [Tepidisphaeraceae bacterium]